MIDGLFERSCAPIRAPDAAPAATVLHRAPPEVVVKPLPARTLLTLASAALLAATPAQADWPADGLQLDSSSHGILGIDFRPCETGDVLTFVRVGANSPYQRIYRISPTGALGPLVPIDSNDYSGFPDYPVATDGAGGLWHAPSGRDVSLEHADGNNVHTPNVSPYFWSIAATTAIENASRVASDGSGGAFTSWLRNGSQLRLKRTSATGVTVAGWPAAGLIVCDDYYLPDMKSDGHGGVWIVAETVEPQIFHLGPTGASVASWGDGSLVLDPPAGSYSVAPRLIPSDSTHFFACWQENSTDRIVVQPFDADGNMAARAVVTSNPNVLTSSVNYTLDSQGGLWVSWRQDSTDLVRHFLADGTPVSGPAALDLSPFDSHARLLQNPYSGINTPAYAAGPSGGLIAIWNDGRLNRPSLRARWLAADGSSEPSEPDSGRVLTVVDSVTYGYNHWTTVTVLGAMSDGAGGVYAGWEFGDRGAASTYARVGHLAHPPAVAPASYHLVLPFRSGGYVTASPNLTSYVSGTLVTVTAVISYGFTFTGWTGDTTSNENPLTIRMLHDRTLTATFADTLAPTAIVLSPNGGSSYPVGSTVSIQWNSGDNLDVTSVDLYYSSTGPAGPFSAIATGLAAFGNYNWTVNGLPTTNGRIKAVAHDAAGHTGSDMSDASFTTTGTLGVDGGVTAFALAPVRPNPAAGAARVGFALPREANVRLSVLDVAGREVRVLADGLQSAGRHEIALSDAGALAPGLYFVRMRAAGHDYLERFAVLH
jgi:uncharacterized repeat protein (TIGR02543 family)